jgi:hypothetical protein
MSKNKFLIRSIVSVLLSTYSLPLLAEMLCQEFETRFVYAGKTQAEVMNACAMESPRGLLFTSPGCMTSDTCQMRKT